MSKRAQLFHIADIITAIIDIQLVDPQSSDVQGAIRHVSESKHRLARGSEDYDNTVDAIRAQLPEPLDQFQVIDLARLVISVKMRCNDDDAKIEVVRALEQTYGKFLPLYPGRYLVEDSPSMSLLKRLAEEPQRLAASPEISTLSGALPRVDDDTPCLDARSDEPSG